MKRLLLWVLVATARPVTAEPKFDWYGHVELEAQNLQSDDASKRLAAVSALGSFDIHLTEKYLMKALDDDDINVRHQAATALGQGHSRAAVPRMIDWLTDPDIKTKIVAAEALGAIGGPDSIAALTRSLGDNDAAVRTHAVQALGSIGADDSVKASVVIALIPRLDDEKTDVKRATIEQLKLLADKRAVIPLVAKFGDNNVEIRKKAVETVGTLNDPAAVPALIRLMTTDSSEDVRMAAVGALGTLGADVAIDALTEQLNVGSDKYRETVAYALGNIAAKGAGPTGEEALRTLVTNLAQPKQRATAREALKKAGKQAVPALVASLQGKIPGDPTIAVGLLETASDARATAVLAAELDRGRVAMPSILKALGHTGDPAALVPVLGALASKDASIRLAAMDALGPLLGTDARAGDVLVEHLADDDLEVRILAAQYLGTLHVGAATPKLVALSGPGNPPRLRHAAIDALGEIGRPEATKALLDVLREGPTDLHRSAATSLSYIADPAAITPLIVLIRSDRGPTRYQAVRALGATMRGRPDNAGRTLLRELAQDANLKVAVAAIAGLAAAGDASDVSFLRTVVEQGAADRRRAAAWALGEMHASSAFDTLATAMSSSDDRLAGDAAWATGEIIAASPKDPHAAELVPRWLHLGRYGRFAAAIDGTAALARVLWATPREARAALIGTTRPQLDALVLHKSRLVRINAARALAALGDDGAIKLLTQLLHDNNASVHVRIAAATGLVETGNPKAAAALKAAEKDAETAVKDAAKAHATALPARSEWRTFYVIDPGADESPVRQEPYFIHGSDHIVWATYTDARGEITSEHAPPGTGETEVLPASREGEY